MAWFYSAPWLDFPPPYRDIDAFGVDIDIDAVADALAPHVEASPILRRSLKDGPWSAAEEALDAAECFVDGARDRVWTDSVSTSLAYLDRLRKAQSDHRVSLVHDRLGVISGYKYVVEDRGPGDMSIELYSICFVPELLSPILKFDAATTRREVEIALSAWRAGNTHGVRAGADYAREEMREEMKALFESEAAGCA